MLSRCLLTHQRESSERIIISWNPANLKYFLYLLQNIYLYYKSCLWFFVTVKQRIATSLATSIDCIIRQLFLVFELCRTLSNSYSVHSTLFIEHKIFFKGITYIFCWFKNWFYHLSLNWWGKNCVKLVIQNYTFFYVWDAGYNHFQVIFCNLDVKFIVILLNMILNLCLIWATKMRDIRST